MDDVVASGRRHHLIAANCHFIISSIFDQSADVRRSSSKCGLSLTRLEGVGCKKAHSEVTIATVARFMSLLEQQQHDAINRIVVSLRVCESIYNSSNLEKKRGTGRAGQCSAVQCGLLCVIEFFLTYKNALNSDANDDADVVIMLSSSHVDDNY